MFRIRIGSVALIIGVATSAWAQPATAPAVDVSVDPRIELMCTIFRLAGNPEYSRSALKAYSADVATYFEPVHDHELVQFARRLRSTRSVSYDAPMSLAVHFADVRSFEGIVPLDPLPEGVDGRWQVEDVREFQRLAKDFVRQGGFDEFIAQHQSLYDESTNRLRQMLEKNAHLEWFDKFFGVRPAARFKVVIGLQDGPGNYGVHVTTSAGEQLYCILGVWQVDANGIPIFSDAEVIPIVVHEFNHSYANPLIEKNYQQLRAAGDVLFKKSEAQMRSQAYSNGKTVLYESLVRASVVRYRYANEGALAASGEVLTQQRRGFVWVGALSAVLDEYERNRETFPTLDSFMPKIVKFFNEYASSAATRP